MEFPKVAGVQAKTPSMGGVVTDIFWNSTIKKYKIIKEIYFWKVKHEKHE